MNRKRLTYGAITLLAIAAIGLYLRMPKPINAFSDDFNAHEKTWIRKQVANTSRYQIVTDPQQEANSCLLLAQHPKDHFGGAKRSEYVFRPYTKAGKLVRYSFKFMFPNDFFKHRSVKDWLIVQQWHDEPPRWTAWEDYKENTRPPVALLLGLKKDAPITIEYGYGLKSNSYDQERVFVFKDSLRPMTWYTFSNEIFWSQDDNLGYSKPMLNGIPFVPESVDSENKVYGANMYNSVPNFYKFGLYGNKKSQDTIAVFLDDFRFEVVSSD